VKITKNQDNDEDIPEIIIPGFSKKPDSVEKPESSSSSSSSVLIHDVTPDDMLTLRSAKHTSTVSQTSTSHSIYKSKKTFDTPSTSVAASAPKAKMLIEEVLPESTTSHSTNSDSRAGIASVTPRETPSYVVSRSSGKCSVAFTLPLEVR
jgi:hypothetical protein